MVFVITETYATTSISKHLWTQLETNRGQNPTSQKHVFDNLGGFFRITLAVYGFNHEDFMQRYLIWPKLWQYEKNHYSKHCKNSISCFPIKS